MTPLFQRLLTLDLLVAFWIWTSSFSVCAVEFNELTFITESSASFNYIRDGKLQGPAVELLLAASNHVGSPIKLENILVQPWARGFKNAQQGPNTVLFSTIRTPERESGFQWVGPIASESDVLIALKARQLRISKPEDMKAFITGAVRGDVGEDILIEEGVPLQKIALLSHSTNLGMMLNAGRIDLWIFGEDGWRETLVSSGIDPANFEVVYRFAPKRYYFALSSDIDQQLVEKFQQAVDSVLAANKLIF
ncbi:ABC transporter substrate-binding protein [uncultured Paraglaciecola sp.]|uniref:substrate-binding periplasmic protein n=1 Tax=uncultured Paraglaciecola sp. TaxID=1765024 RepID=UPI0030D8CC9C|tara:strand:+ start:82304 stop:83053 length:750 start_codon:yes stop_codon:yes gene_type:complete